MLRTHTISVLVFWAVISGVAFSQPTASSKHNVYGHRDGMAMYYDVEVPVESNGLGIVFIVSGGFVSGIENLTLTKPFWEVLLANGYTLFQLYHPGMPTYRIPDAVQAVEAGIEHIRLHADSLGIDPTRLGALGISSGGYLALQAALSIDPVERSENDLKAVVAIMPITDLRTIPPDETLFGVRHMDFDPALIPGLSPINFVTPDDPPTLLIHGSRDAVVNLQSNSQALERLLNQSVVNSRLLIVDAGHEIFPEPVMQLSHEAMLEWFEAHL